MPYNTAAIPPRRDPTGSTQLPLSRIKKMIALDTDISMCSNNATFVVTLATEMFIQYMAEQGHNVVKSERKPRRNIQYKDLSSAVSRLDNLEFLSDVVPRTVTYKAIKAKKPVATPAPGPVSNGNGNGEGSSSGPSHPNMEAGQTTLDGMANGTSLNGFNVHINPHIHTNGVGGDGDEGEAEAADPNTQLEMEIRGAGEGGGEVAVTSAVPIRDVNDQQEVGGQDVEMS